MGKILRPAFPHIGAADGSQLVWSITAFCTFQRVLKECIPARVARNTCLCDWLQSALLRSQVCACCPLIYRHTHTNTPLSSKWIKRITRNKVQKCPRFSKERKKKLISYTELFVICKPFHTVTIKSCSRHEGRMRAWRYIAAHS